ncbi:type VII secretion system-associated protein [Crossiella sp. CA198]|uniref:type VII secretion system-associated protein n=1 Tax=Crossiella sp. CA198 TaxID=3455607 RepID=UPI003F8D44B1
MTDKHWVYLVDPDWRAGPDGAEPPATAVTGGWLVEPDGRIGAFHPNPDYLPAGPDSPTDPVDAALRRLDEGVLDAEAFFAVLRTGTLGLAVDQLEEPVVAPAPDDVPSLLITTAPAHRPRVGAAGWRAVSLTELALLLAEYQVDLLINPGAPASLRLHGAAVVRAAG